MSPCSIVACSAVSQHRVLCCLERSFNCHHQTDLPVEAASSVPVVSSRFSTNIYVYVLLKMAQFVDQGTSDLLSGLRRTGKNQTGHRHFLFKRHSKSKKSYYVSVRGPAPNSRQIQASSVKLQTTTLFARTLEILLQLYRLRHYSKS